MSREVLSSRDYRYVEQKYLIDNLLWQEEIKQRLAEEVPKQVVDPHPTLNTDELEPFFLPEVAEEEAEPAKPLEPTAKEILEKTRAQAEEAAKAIEQSAKKNAFEIVEKARWEVEDIIEKAKKNAEKEIQNLKEAAEEEGKKKGLEEGYQQGLEKGRMEGLQTYSDLLRKWNHLLEETASERKKLLGELQPILVELVGEALHHCLKKEAQAYSQMVVEFAKEALKKAQDKVHLQLHLHPEDVAEVEKQKATLQLSIGTGMLELVPDARIERGGCLLKTEAGSVDIRLETVVAQVKESLSSGMA